ncbi:hypothetical protein ILYODFUR_023733 [Ilyodon furcidens]|uniref:Uncharacterized protein n=1 Tax=Ilyodon furcidens TaxID=33524 RepID=A0ABV0TN19_9TELE
MNLPIFLYQTDFQLSSSSRNGHMEEKIACELLSLRICTSVASSCETLQMAAKTLFPQLFTILGDVKAVTPVELHMSNCAAYSKLIVMNGKM